MQTIWANTAFIFNVWCFKRRLHASMTLNINTGACLLCVLEAKGAFDFLVHTLLLKPIFSLIY